MNRGFSLLELSIVLVIIGLITGGIMAGRSMVRAAELRSVMSDVSKYQSAINTFREKYNGYPGDLKNATAYWGAAHATPATCKTTQGTGTQTCDGDGNGQIGRYEGLAQPGEVKNETFRAWQQMANAGLVEGNYTGITTGVSSLETSPGNNVPASKITGAGYNLIYLGVDPSSTYHYPGTYNNVIIFGRPGSYHGIGYASVISTEDAYTLDSKMDDGMAALGIVKTALAGNPTGGATGSSGCANSAAPSVAAYDLTNKNAQACGLFFVLGF